MYDHVTCIVACIKEARVSLKEKLSLNFACHLENTNWYQYFRESATFKMVKER